MNNTISRTVTFGEHSNRNKWNEAVLFELRKHPLYLFEQDIYLNGYTQPNPFVHVISSNKRKGPIREPIRQKWQYNIIKYLEDHWIPHQSKQQVIKREYDDLIDISSLTCPPEIEDIIRNKKIKIEYE
jgi:hypothetical protein